MTVALRVSQRSRTAGERAATGQTRDANHAMLLPCRVRLADGRVFTGELAAARHRAIQLAMLHARSIGFLELTRGTRRLDGRLVLGRRRRANFLPAGGSGDPRWLERALQHAERVVAGVYARSQYAEGPREEAFVGVAARTHRAGNREHVSESRWLWVDVDNPGNLERLYAFLAARPCHLLIESGGSGGVHAYWQLAAPLPAAHVNEQTGQWQEPIERANLRLIAAVGGDHQCHDRSRLLRLAGSRNHKSGRYARIISADLALPPYTLGELVGDLPDPEPDRVFRSAHADAHEHDDPYRRISASDYMVRLAGRKPDRAGFVRCPTPEHEDRHPSCSVRGPHPECFRCHSCGASGGIYDLASIMLGGPYGRGQLHGEDFKRARELVVQTFGEQ